MTPIIDDPVALAVVEWLSPQAGGEPNGPPRWPYAAGCEFLSEDMHLYPGHRENLGVPFTFSLEPVELISDTIWRVKMDLLARESALPCLWEGRQMVIREGPHVVAVAVITAVLVEMSRKEDTD